MELCGPPHNSKNGRDFTHRFSGIRDALMSLPCTSAIINGEVVACKKDETPDFRGLHSGNYSQEILCVWCFHLMELNGPSAAARKQKLGALLGRHDHPYVRYSEPFKIGEQSLSKGKHAPYKSVSAIGSK